MTTSGRHNHRKKFIGMDSAEIYNRAKETARKHNYGSRPTSPLHTDDPSTCNYSRGKGDPLEDDPYDDYDRGGGGEPPGGDDPGNPNNQDGMGPSFCISDFEFIPTMLLHIGSMMFNDTRGIPLFMALAYQNMYTGLVLYLAGVSSSPPVGAIPENLTKKPISLQTGVAFDAVPIGKGLGPVLADAATSSTYKLGQRLLEHFKPPTPGTCASKEIS
ncbi:hypothetical protein RSAG8_13244, partial [Rhizoctonia solani AG-8 WAC10335]